MHGTPSCCLPYHTYTHGGTIPNVARQNILRSFMVVPYRNAMATPGNSSRIHHFKLVLLGDTAVGKSCLVVRFVRDEFFEFQEPTIGGTNDSSSMKSVEEGNRLTWNISSAVPIRPPMSTCHSQQRRIFPRNRIVLYPGHLLTHTRLYPLVHHQPQLPS